MSADVLRVSPSVRMDFHDAPERHHNDVIRQYPRTWQSPHTERNQDGRREHPEHREVEPKIPEVKKHEQSDSHEERRDTNDQHSSERNRRNTDNQPDQGTEDNKGLNQGRP